MKDDLIIIDFFKSCITAIVALGVQESSIVTTGMTIINVVVIIGMDIAGFIKADPSFFDISYSEVRKFIFVCYMIQVILATLEFFHYQMYKNDFIEIIFRQYQRMMIYIS